MENERFNYHSDGERKGIQRSRKSRKRELLECVSSGLSGALCAASAQKGCCICTGA